jgi:hypothetical protein
MLVVSMPRSGGTKFCMNLSEELGLPYVGDMNPMNIKEFGASWAKIKQSHHEVEHDQSISMKNYMLAIQNMDNCVMLCNNSNHLMLPRADKFFLRINFGNSIRSLANYWLKISPKIDEGMLLQTIIIPTIMNGKLVYEYIRRNECDVTWYEHYFNDKPCVTPLLDNNSYLKKMVEELCISHEI